MLRTIGLMSGTSLDGVDAAWLETDGVSVSRFGPRLTLPYDDGLRHNLRQILDCAPILRSGDEALESAVCRLTEYHARAVTSLGEAADLIGFHGQTILHRPAERWTWQIGNPALLARLTNLPVAHDFRSADVMAGGEGAPLAPRYHAALAAALPKPLAILNIGGVANVTWIGARGELVAFDTGPGNGPLDDWARLHLGTAFDCDGDLARSGRPNEPVLSRLLTACYFNRPPPKSLDRLAFSQSIAASGSNDLSAEDGAATLVAFIARSVKLAPLPEPPARWLVCGGGRKNPEIMRALRGALPAPVEPVEVVGWDGDALEAQCFGFLAARVKAGLPLTYPSTTGISRPLPGGRIYPAGGL